MEAVVNTLQHFPSASFVFWARVQCAVVALANLFGPGLEGFPLEEEDEHALVWAIVVAVFGELNVSRPQKDIPCKLILVA